MAYPIPPLKKAKVTHPQSHPIPKLFLHFLNGMGLRMCPPCFFAFLRVSIGHH